MPSARFFSGIKGCKATVNPRSQAHGAPPFGHRCEIRRSTFMRTRRPGRRCVAPSLRDVTRWRDRRAGVELQHSQGAAAAAQGRIPLRPRPVPKPMGSQAGSASADGTVRRVPVPLSRPSRDTAFPAVMAASRCGECRRRTCPPRGPSLARKSRWMNEPLSVSAASRLQPTSAYVPQNGTSSRHAAALHKPTQHPRRATHRLRAHSPLRLTFRGRRV